MSKRAPGQNPVEHVMRERIVVGLANHTKIRSRTGAETPIEDSAAPILNDDGKMLGVILVFHDVGDKREIETRLEEAEWRYRTALEIGRAGCWVWEAEQDRVTGRRHALAHASEFLSRPASRARLPGGLSRFHSRRRPAPGSSERSARHWSRAAPTRRSFECGMPPGITRSLEARGKVEAGVNGNTGKRLIGFFMDNTEARERSRLLALRADIAAQLGVRR